MIVVPGAILRPIYVLLSGPEKWKCRYLVREGANKKHLLVEDMSENGGGGGGSQPHVCNKKLCFLQRRKRCSMFWNVKYASGGFRVSFDFFSRNCKFSLFRIYSFEHKKTNNKNNIFFAVPKKSVFAVRGGGARTLGICSLQIEVTIDGIDAFTNDVRFLCCKNLPPSLSIADFGISLLKEKYKTYLVVLLHCVM